MVVEAAIFADLGGLPVIATVFMCLLLRLPAGMNY